MNAQDLEKLIHCLQAMKRMREDDVIYPGTNRIIEEAEEALSKYPNLIPDWYKFDN